MPLLPRADTAEEEDILKAHAAVIQYLKQQESFLACVNSDLKHDAAIDRMREVTEKFNKLARRYKSRLKAMDMFTDLAMRLDQ